MNIRISTISRRTISVAFAAALLAGTLAGTTSAASPAGDTLDADFDFRDETGQTVVLAIYPFSDIESVLSSFIIKGPRVSWIESHPDSGGFVGWKVIVKTAPTKNGPWTVDRQTRLDAIAADTTGKLERFPNRKVNFRDRTGTFYVQVTSRLVWFLEDGNGPLGSAQHTYTDYGLVWNSGIAPEFGDEQYTRRVAPNQFPNPS